MEERGEDRAGEATSQKYHVLIHKATKVVFFIQWFSFILPFVLEKI